MNKRKVLKAVKWIAVALSSAYVLFFLLFAYASTGWSRLGEDGDFLIHYHKWSGDAVVADYFWDGDENNMTVIIPDEADGKKINNLGGPTRRGLCIFKIECPFVIKEDSEFNFTVKLGTNMKHADHFTYSEKISFESYGVDYRVNYYYEVSENNKWIYSKDGKLYDKKTDELLGITSG